MTAPLPKLLCRLCHRPIMTHQQISDTTAYGTCHTACLYARN